MASDIPLSRAFEIASGVLAVREQTRGGGDIEENKRHQSISRVRKRVTEELPKDIAVLEEHHPDLLEELRDVVCEDDQKE